MDNLDGVQRLRPIIVFLECLIREKPFGLTFVRWFGAAGEEFAAQSRSGTGGGDPETQVFKRKSILQTTFENLNYQPICYFLNKKKKDTLSY